MERGASIVLITPDRQVSRIDPSGRVTPLTLGADPRILLGSWRGGATHKKTHAWPTWAPDGRRIAVFETDESGSSSVVVLEADGISATTVCELGPRLPIYLFWSPDGAEVAVLTQHTEGRGDKLHLGLCRAHHAEGARTLAEGTPLFFTWADDRIAAFVGDGDTQEARVMLLPPGGLGRLVLMPGRPGNFCAPVWLGERLMYVVQAGSRAVVVSAGPDEAEPTVMDELRGLVALVRSPDGRKVARAVAPRGDGSPYQHLAVYDVRSDTWQELGDHPCLAFLWLPDGSGLLSARVDTTRNLMSWSIVDLAGRARPVIEAYPTRDLGFYLRFFEQYSQSHHLVDPTGRTLLLSGGLAGHGDPHRTQVVWEVPLGGGPPQRVADGVFAVYGPATR